MTNDVSPEFWRRCSSCKKTIAYKATHYVCSVSTCTRKRTGYVFCSVHCWERHLPGARHRDAAAIEARSPSYDEWKREIEADEAQSPAPKNAAPSQAEASPKRVIIREAPSSAAPIKSSASKEILVVASKLKAYIRARSEMNTSDAVMEILSDQLRKLCDEAIESARADGRKTVLERDFK